MVFLFSISGYKNINFPVPFSVVCYTDKSILGLEEEPITTRLTKVLTPLFDSSDTVFLLQKTSPQQLTN